MNGIETLLGKTLVKIDKTDDQLVFTTNNNEVYKLYHEQDCCESVTIEDIIGDLDDLIGLPILMAEEITNNGDLEYGDHFTWTFYKLATLNGYVTVRWYGTSNGYYSEGVYFTRV